ncbi:MULTISPECIES: cell wall-active antibiotics response protein LiaF [unclassified Granulicatella]|uniref:cell wall-active antibiotics response protein LiaF n=1 Tax=unclassified Granulicatella TaxID=2630493 RepID=UPI00107395F2|nr:MULTISPECIES: cell wall-active antibiotics response protein LiaF [unclassified Granulicatella]MBF0780730.1 cell wall-active antibiotics response protein [Granulicatella sp. 19428wC4_WM01]TFU94189.1 hypothetical protein E4T68_06415 [Granulicatella sp. WM01]
MLKKINILVSVGLSTALFVMCLLLLDLFKSEDIIFIVLSLILFSISIFYIKNWLGKFIFSIAMVLLFLFVLTRPNFWILLGIIGIGALILWWGILKRMQQKFDTVALELSPPSPEKYARVQKAYWLQERKMISSNYEWDDIHLMSWFGDTTIHLGNTILPEETSIIVIHKLIGDVRIIVPLGVGVSLNHSTIRGHVLFEKEHHFLKHEQLSIYSENYIAARRRIKIVTSVYVGNVEVIHI